MVALCLYKFNLVCKFKQSSNIKLSKSLTLHPIPHRSNETQHFFAIKSLYNIFGRQAFVSYVLRVGTLAILCNPRFSVCSTKFYFAQLCNENIKTAEQRTVTIRTVIGIAAQPRPLLAIPNVTVHPSTATVPTSLM